MPPTKKTPVPPEIYQIKVTLLGTRPPVWRRVLVPSNLTFARFHHVLQSVMGWADCHLHEFFADERRIGQPDLDEGFTSVEDERKLRLSGIWGRVASKVLYTYDFGDNWEHSLVLEKRLPVHPELTYPICTGGKLACPPEDCGGIPGYYELLEALKHPGEKRFKETLEWLGDFDPHAFSLEQANRMLTPLRSRRGPPLS